MKFVRLSSNFPVTKVENNLKKANYYKDGDEAYTIWDVGDFDKNQLGIHLSYNSDKKKICEYIQSQYDYYDSLNGGYAGDKYTDIIWQEAMNKYGLTSSQLDVIWMNGYSY